MAIDRRDFLKLAGIAAGAAGAEKGAAEYADGRKASLRIEVTEVQHELAGSYAKPVMVKFHVHKCGDMFKLKLSSDGTLYFDNGHYIHDHLMGSYMKMTASDLESYDSVIRHWKKIRENFIRCIEHGAWFTGHTSDTYEFPNGRSVKYPVKEIPESFKPAKGPPLDKKFSSNWCEYIDGYPYRQHYKHGRFDYYLEREEIELKDGKRAQVLEGRQPEAVLELLKFIKGNEPSGLIEKIGNISTHR